MGSNFDFEALDESGVLEQPEEEKEVEQEQEDNQSKADESTEEEKEVVEPEGEEEADNESEQEYSEEEEVDEEPEEKPKKKVVEKQPYTEAEIQAILESDGEIDTSRLSPAEQATMKAMQRGFTPKLQEAAELRREVEELRKQIQPTQEAEQPADIYEAYDRDPDGVIQYVDSQINELAATNDPEKLMSIRQLESLKYEFNRRDLKKMQERAMSTSQVNEHMANILRVVPDLASKQQALKEFAINELGYTEQELAHETNPQVSGAHAVRAIERINTAYDKAIAKRTVKTKKRAKKANTVEKPSSTQVSKPDVDELLQAKKHALESGNFDDFFEAMGED